MPYILCIMYIFRLARKVQPPKNPPLSCSYFLSLKICDFFQGLNRQACDLIKEMDRGLQNDYTYVHTFFSNSYVSKVEY